MFLGSLETTCSNSWYSRLIACLSLNPLPLPVLFKRTETWYASGEALRGLGDRSRATTVELWIGTTEIRPTLITARRRAPARQPGTAPMSTV